MKTLLAKMKKSQKNTKNISKKKKKKKVLNGYYIHDGKITYLYEEKR